MRTAGGRKHPARWVCSGSRRALLRLLRGPLFPLRALCHLVLKQYKEAVKDCTEALRLDGKNVKAFYRRAQAYKALKVKRFWPEAPTEPQPVVPVLALPEHGPGEGYLPRAFSSRGSGAPGRPPGWGAETLCGLSSDPHPRLVSLGRSSIPTPSLSSQDYKSSFADINSLLQIEPRNGPAQKLRQEVNRSLN